MVLSDQELEVVNQLYLEQKTAAGLIKNFLNNTRKSKAAADFTAHDYRARLDLLENRYWIPFLSRHFRIAPLADDQKYRSYFSSNLFTQTENEYVQATSWLKEQIQRLSPARAVQETAPLPRQPRDAYSSSDLEKLKLPRFSGKQLDWDHFKERFQAMVGRDPVMPGVIKLQRLMDCLEGEALEMLKSLESSNENFTVGWDSLCRRYDNRYLRLKCQLRALSQRAACTVESGSQINGLINMAIDAQSVLRNVGENVDQWDRVFIFFVEEKLPRQTRLDWAKQVESKPAEELPAWAEFRTFLENRVRSLEVFEYDGERSEPKSGQSKDQSKLSKQSKPGKSTSAHVVSKANKAKNPCSYCAGPHFLAYCKDFAACGLSQRWKIVRSKGLCFNCLNSGHSVEGCSSKGRCMVCGDKHHLKLHQDSVRTSAPTEDVAEGRPSTSTNVACASTSPATETPRRVLMATACVNLVAPSGNVVTVRALLDSCAEESFVSSYVVQALALRPEPVSVSVSGVGGQVNVVAHGRVSLRLQFRSPTNFNLELTALVLRRLTAVTPADDVIVQNWPHLRGLQLADAHFARQGRVDCILNASVFAAVLLPGIRRGGSDEPTALQTQLGWILLGPCSAAPGRGETSVACTTAVCDQLSEQLSRFWELEEPHTASPLSSAEQLCYDFFKSTTTRDATGRFIVRQVFTRTLIFADTFSIAEQCFTRLERRFKKNPALQAAYADFMKEYEMLGHMEVAAHQHVSRESVFYLPHHPVLRKGNIDKIHVVFNASQTDQNGVSLNSVLHSGPKLQEELYVVLLRWAFFKYVFVCDIVKMFRQFLMSESDRDWQRILWRPTADSPILAYRLNTVTYGTASAPFQANACLLKLADDEEASFPRAAVAIRENRYADDFLVGADTVEGALTVRQQLVDILAAGGMRLGKWTANSTEILHSLSDETIVSQERAFTSQEAVSTLDINWTPSDDAFSLRISIEPATKVTKRSILSSIARLFDPVGWLAPVVIKAKLILQQLWMQGADWDAEVCPTVRREWDEFLEQLPAIESVRIPRWLGTREETTWQLHGFCDASERAYAAVVYLVTSQERSVRFLAAKSKVAPIKVISVPKLELCAAQLCVKLIVSLLSKLQARPESVFCWSDSMVVLAWLRGHPSRWKPFVANRVSYIVSALPEASWSHVGTLQNPADCASRGLPPDKLREFSLWWSGPEWLHGGREGWPSVSISYSTLESAQ